MVSAKTARELSLSFEATDEKPHFDRFAFRVKRKIFCTLSEEKEDMNLKLTLHEQSVFCKADPEIIHPVPGGWGRQGWTTIHLPKTPKGFFKDALTTAYCNIAPLKLAEKYRQYGSDL